MRLWHLGIYLLLTGFTSVSAGQHSACSNLNLTATDYSVDDLLAIAQSCEDQAVSELYFHRANHQRLLKKYTRFERSLTRYRGQAGQAYIDAYRIHIGLAEAFAGQRLTPEEIGVLNRLNHVYERSGEIAEMRFRGYDLVADRMEREFKL